MAETPEQREQRQQADADMVEALVAEDLTIPPHYSKEWTVTGHVLSVDKWSPPIYVITEEEIIPCASPICLPFAGEVEGTEVPITAILDRIAALETRLAHIEKEHGILPK